MSAADRPLVVVSLPARTVEEARAQTSLAAAAGADLAEVRCDRWTTYDRDALSRLFPSALPLVATLRSRREGGDGPDDPARRGAWREWASRLPFAFIDLERDRDLADDRTVPPTGRATAIVSSHLPAGSPVSEIRTRLSEFGRGPEIVKVIVPASVGACVREIEPILRDRPAPRRILHTTGPSGPLLRAWARRLGLFAVYASLNGGGPNVVSVEPSQIPVSRLKPFLEAPAGAPLFAVVGRPIAHSLSPTFHHRWMREDRHPGLYVPLEIGDDDEFASALSVLAARGFRGLNVTHPFKEAALRIADRATDRAKRCRAGNTLSFGPSGVEVDNTDVVAASRRLGELVGEGQASRKTVVVVGSGGAARAALAAAMDGGWTATVLGRDLARTRAIASEFHAAVAAAPEPPDVLVNATPVGRADAGEMDLDLAPWLDSSTHVVDFVYRADRDDLPRLAARRSATYEDGARLLGYAAAASYERWWGELPSPSRIESALAEAP